jgi:hypothetical protein
MLADARGVEGGGYFAEIHLACLGERLLPGKGSSIPEKLR